MADKSSGVETTANPALAGPGASWSAVLGRASFWLILIFVLGWSYGGAGINPGTFAGSLNDMGDFLVAFLRPSFTDWRYYMEQMIVTIQIAIWGTFLAIVLAIPSGLLASSNIAPWWIRHPVRRLMDAFRAINEIVFALIFTAAVGLGPFAGVLALFVHTWGTLAKLFSEAVETIDSRPVEGIRATGGSAIDEINYGVIPQVMPLWISYTLYRFESNVRSATVLGAVGAGGIGFALQDTIKSFKFGQTSAILIIVVITVIALDLISSRIRKQFI